MKAMVLDQVVSLSENCRPLRYVDLPTPKPGEKEVLVRVLACGVCHTELDEIEGRTPPSKFPIVLGHEIIGRVAALGEGVNRFEVGDRVGVGWIHSSTGDALENLSADFRATGRDVDGGYAEYMTVPCDYAYRIPPSFADLEAAPLMCAGGIGYRALRLSGITDGQSLGLMGFGASAHLMLQTVRHLQPKTRLFVFAREPSQRQFALELGAIWSGDIGESPPSGLHAIVDTTPAWKPIVESLKYLLPGGRLVINAIRKEDTDRDYLQHLTYHEHLWMEKEIKTVANITHFDLEEFLPIAAAIPIQPAISRFPLEQANEALLTVRRGGHRGAVVLDLG